MCTAWNKSSAKFGNQAGNLMRESYWIEVGTACFPSRQINLSVCNQKCKKSVQNSEINMSRSKGTIKHCMIMSCFQNSVKIFSQ